MAAFHSGTGEHWHTFYSCTMPILYLTMELVMIEIGQCEEAITGGAFTSSVKSAREGMRKFYTDLFEEAGEVYTIIGSPSVGDASLDDVKISTELGLIVTKNFNALDKHGKLAGWVVFYGKSPNGDKEPCRLLTVRVTERACYRTDGTPYRDGRGNNWVTLTVIEAMAELLRLDTEYIHATSQSPQ